MAQVDESDTTVATNDAYTGMLAISLLALVLGAALLYLDWSQYPDKEAPKVKAPSPKLDVPQAAPQGQAAPGPGQQAPMNPMPMQPMPEQKGN
jgi:hypothetical protein